MRLLTYLLYAALTASTLGSTVATATDIGSIAPEPTYGNPQEDFSKAMPRVGFSTSHKVRLSVIDEREYVKSGEYGINYVGLQRGIGGIPAKTITASSGSLANELQKALSDGLSKAGIANYVPDPRILYNDAENELSLVVTLNDWYTDIFRKTVGFSFNVTVAVFDQAGNKLVSTFVEGFESYSSQLDAFSNALSQALAKEQVVAALTHPTTFKNNKAAKSPAAPPTSDDPRARLSRLKEMLDAGLIAPQDYEAKKAEILKAM